MNGWEICRFCDTVLVRDSPFTKKLPKVSLELSDAAVHEMFELVHVWNQVPIMRTAEITSWSASTTAVFCP
jgi:hypothetical protein